MFGRMATFTKRDYLYVRRFCPHPRIAKILMGALNPYKNIASKTWLFADELFVWLRSYRDYFCVWVVLYHLMSSEIFARCGRLDWVLGATVEKPRHSITKSVYHIELPTSPVLHQFATEKRSINQNQIAATKNVFFIKHLTIR